MALHQTWALFPQSTEMSFFTGFCPGFNTGQNKVGNLSLACKRKKKKKKDYFWRANQLLLPLADKVIYFILNHWQSGLKKISSFIFEILKGFSYLLQLCVLASVWQLTWTRSQHWFLPLDEFSSASSLKLEARMSLSKLLKIPFFAQENCPII